MFITAISYFLPIVGLFIIGSVPLLKNRVQRVNIVFFGLSLVMAAWLTGLYLADTSASDTTGLLAVRGAAFVGTLMAPLILYLGHVFPVELKKPTGALITYALVPTVFFMSLAFTNLLIPGVRITNGSAQPDGLGMLYTLQSVYLISCFIAGFVIMFSKRNRVNSRHRSQIKVVIAGLITSLLVNVFTGLYLTMFNHSNSTTNLAGAFSLLAFVSAMSYAIVRYRLFDIRLAITRLIGYSVTIFIVAGLYSVLIIIISSQLGSFKSLELSELLVLLVPTMFVGITFSWVERFVRKYTQHIFYQDAYDVRTVLNELSDALLAESDIHKIMEQSVNVISGALKSRSAYLAILNSSGVIYEHVTVGRSKSPEVTTLLQRISKEPANLVDRGENPNKALSHTMYKEDVELLLRLGTQKDPVGLLLLGSKQNGSMYTPQDIDLLRISAKNLSIALNNAKKYQQILHFADTLHREVKRATSKLRHANQELKTLDSLKDDFIATASHQLRTPSTSVHDALVMINHPSLDENDRREMLKLAEASSEHLLTVVRTMLNMARLQAGHFTIDKSQTDLVALLESVIAQVKILAEQKHITIKVNKPKGEVTMFVDIAKINEALSNYIENAIKYSPQHSTVTITMAKTADQISFEIEDQGIGVPEAECQDLFGKFYRASNARNEQPDGNGIGLYVVRSIAEGHGGEAYFRPSASSGSVFGLWIPADKTRTIEK